MNQEIVSPSFLLILDCFKEPILLFKLSLTKLGEMGSVSEANLRDGKLFRLKSRLDARGEMSSMSDQFANRVATSIGASVGQPTDYYQNFSDLNLKESFSSMIRVLKEMREIELQCKEGKPSPRANRI